jgi:hypothetical protein
MLQPKSLHIEEVLQSANPFHTLTILLPKSADVLEGNDWRGSRIKVLRRANSLLTLPVQTVDATLPNALIRECFSAKERPIWLSSVKA